MLEGISVGTHKSMTEIVLALDDAVIQPVLNYPGVWELLDVESIQDAALRAALEKGK